MNDKKKFFQPISSHKIYDLSYNLNNDMIQKVSLHLLLSSFCQKYVMIYFKFNLITYDNIIIKCQII